MKYLFTKMTLIFAILAMLAFALPLIGCGDDDDDDDDDATPVDDDDATDDDQTDDDSGDDDVVATPVPTTVDKTFIPVENNDGWQVGEGPGETHQILNDLGVLPLQLKAEGEPLSMAYFPVITDLHQVDEESPARLTFFDSLTILDGAFNSAFRPQEDLAPHLLNAIVRTLNRVAVDYGRDFDLLLALGDSTDNGQLNEMSQMIDILDGGGLTSGIPGYVTVDSGDLDIDPETGLNRGERNYGIQEIDGDGNNINAFNRPGYPNSNADIPAEGLQKANGDDLPWFVTVGNHDVLATGTFDPDSGFTIFTTDKFTSAKAPYGYIPGLASTVQYTEENPNQPLHISDGVFGIDLDWRLAINMFKLLGFVPDNYTTEIDPRFDLMTLLNDTPEDPSDDGVAVTADPNRVFMRHEMLVELIYNNGHGMADNNGDTVVDETDGGYYRVEWSQINPGSTMPLRILFLDSGEITYYDEGGLSEDQFNWLEAELAQAELDEVLVIIANHHYLHAIPNDGERLGEMLNGCPNVILHLVGHGHDNKVEARPAVSLDPLYGYWEVETASMIEFPQQSRIVEIVDNRDGTGTVYMTMLDHYPIYGDDADTLSDLARNLSFEDILRYGYEGEPVFGGTGQATDRNVGLMFAIPAGIVDKLAQIESTVPVTSTEVFGTLY